MCMGVYDCLHKLLVAMLYTRMTLVELYAMNEM